MDNDERLNLMKKNINLRLFQKEYNIIKDIIENNKLDDGSKKYDNVSHFVRCAVMNLIKLGGNNGKIK